MVIFQKTRELLSKFISQNAFHVVVVLFRPLIPRGPGDFLNMVGKILRRNRALCGLDGLIDGVRDESLVRLNLLSESVPEVRGNDHVAIFILLDNKSVWQNLLKSGDSLGVKIGTVSLHARNLSLKDGDSSIDSFNIIGLEGVEWMLNGVWEVFARYGRIHKEGNQGCSKKREVGGGEDPRGCKLRTRQTRKGNAYDLMNDPTKEPNLCKTDQACAGAWNGAV